MLSPSARVAVMQGLDQSCRICFQAGLLTRLLEEVSLIHLAAAYTSESKLRVREGSHRVFVDLISEVTDYDFHQIPFIRCESLSAQQGVRPLHLKDGKKFKFLWMYLKTTISVLH